MQNNYVCPIIPQDPDDIIEMARNIGMDQETLKKTMKRLKEEVNTCPMTSNPLSIVLGTGVGASDGGWSGRGGAFPPNESGPEAATNLTRLVKMFILAIPTYLIVGGYFMNSGHFQTLSAGINAVFSGECTYLTTRIYTAFGMGNPICDKYNSMMATIYRAMNLNGVDMAVVGSSLTLLLATPALFNSFVAILTSLIAHTLNNAGTMTINDATLAALAANASGAWTIWSNLTTNTQASNLIPPRVALVAGISPPDNQQTRSGPQRERRGGTKRKTRKSKRNSRKSKVTKRKTKRLNKKLSRKTKHGRRKKARKTKKYN
jgi:hypothetical protein